MIKYKVVSSSSHPSESDLQNEYKKGYVLVSVAAHDQNNDPPNFFATYAYYGGPRTSTGGFNNG